MITVLDKTLEWLHKQEDCFERNILINTVENIKEDIYKGIIDTNIGTNCTYNCLDPMDYH